MHTNQVICIGLQITHRSSCSAYPNALAVVFIKSRKAAVNILYVFSYVQLPGLDGINLLSPIQNSKHNTLAKHHYSKKVTVRNYWDISLGVLAGVLPYSLFFVSCVFVVIPTCLVLCPSYCSISCLVTCFPFVVKFYPMVLLGTNLFHVVPSIVQVTPFSIQMFMFCLFYVLSMSCCVISFVLNQ